MRKLSLLIALSAIIAAGHASAITGTASFAVTGPSVCIGGDPAFIASNSSFTLKLEPSETNNGILYARESIRTDSIEGITVGSAPNDTVLIVDGKGVATGSGGSQFTFTMSGGRRSLSFYGSLESVFASEDYSIFGVNINTNLLAIFFAS